MSDLRPHDTEIIRIACLREEVRIAQIHERFKGDEAFILAAVVRGWSLENAIREHDSKQHAATPHLEAAQGRIAS
jgi:hypothetical protein